MPKSRKPRKASRKTSRKGKKCPPGCVKKTLKRSRKSTKRSRRRVSRKVSRKRRSVKRKVSRKRRSVKRKASRKRRSVKRKASRKRKSVKRKTSRKKKSVKRKASRKKKSVKRKTSRKRKSAKRKASRKRKSAKRKSRKRKSAKRKSRKRKSAKRKSRKRKSAKRKSRKHHKGKFRISSWWKPWKHTYSLKKFIPGTSAHRDRKMRHAVKKQQHIEGQQYRDGLIQVIKRIKPGMPRSTYLDVAEIFIKYGYGFTPNQRREMLGMLGKEKIRLSPNVLIMRGQIKQDYKKEDYMKANNHRLKAAWAYYFTHKRKLYNKQMKSQNPNWKNMSHKNFITVHTDKLENQKKKERCLQLQGIVSQTKNAQIKATGLKEMKDLRCYTDKQFEKQLVRVSRQTKLRSAAKQLKADPNKVQQMKEQFQKYNKICARYGGYYGRQKIPPRGEWGPVCKEKGLGFPRMPVSVAEKQLQKGTAVVTKLQAIARKQLVRKKIGNVKDAAKLQEQVRAWENMPLGTKALRCRQNMNTIMQGGPNGAAAQLQYKRRNCKGVKNRITQALKKAGETKSNLSEEEKNVILSKLK